MPWSIGSACQIAGWNSIGGCGEDTAVVDAETFAYLGFRDVFVRDDGVTVRRVSAEVSHGVVDRIGQRP